MCKNVVLTIRHSDYKGVLLNKKYLRHLMNGIKSEDHKDRFIKSTRFLCLALIIKYTSKTMDVMGLPLVIRVNYKKKKTVTSITIVKWMIENIVQTNIIRDVAIEGRHGGSCLPPTLISEPKKFQQFQFQTSAYCLLWVFRNYVDQ